MKLRRLENVVKDRLREQLREINALVGSAESCLESHDYEQVSARIDLIQRACATSEFERRVYGVTTMEKQRTSDQNSGGMNSVTGEHCEASK